MTGRSPNFNTTNKERFPCKVLHITLMLSRGLTSTRSLKIQTPKVVEGRRYVQFIASTGYEELPINQYEKDRQSNRKNKQET